MQSTFVADRDVSFAHILIGNSYRGGWKDEEEAQEDRKEQLIYNNAYDRPNLPFPSTTPINIAPNYILNSSPALLTSMHAGKCKCTQTVGESNVIHHLLLFAD